MKWCFSKSSESRCGQRQAGASALALCVLAGVWFSGSQVLVSEVAAERQEVRGAVVGVIQLGGAVEVVQLEVAEAAAPGGDDRGLLGRGEIVRLAEPISRIAVLGYEGRRLKLNREAWDRLAGAADADADQGQVQVPNIAGQPNIQIRGRMVVPGMAPGEQDALGRLWAAVRQAAGAGSSSSTMGGRRVFSFEGRNLSGRLTVDTNAFAMNLSEAGGLGRSLDVVERASGGELRVQITAANGDTIMLIQQAGGAVRVVRLQGNDVKSIQAKDWLELYLGHHEWLEGELFPMLAKLGVTMPHSPMSGRVRSAVLRDIRPPDETVGPRGRKLIADLAGDSFAVREKATETLTEQFEVFESMIRQALEGGELTVEQKARLEQIVNEGGSKTSSPADDSRALELARNPRYLRLLAASGLLDEADRKLVEQRAAELE